MLRLFLISILGLSLFSCSIENAKPKKEKTLTIASDILTSADSIYFEDFIAKNKVKIRIVERSGDELIGDFRNDPYSSGYDVLFLSSLYEFNKMYRLGLIQENPNRDAAIYDSKEHGFFGVAIDPFIIRYDPDSTLLIRSFSDLTEYSFHNKLPTTDEVPLLASLLGKMNKVKAYEWIKKYNQKQNVRGNYTNAVLLRYSDQKILDDDSTFREMTSIHYPRSRSNGASYDLVNISIVKQAENYTLANDLITYVLDEKTNRKLSLRLNCIPITEGSNRIKYFRMKNEDLLQYYTMTERILNKNR